MVDIFFDVVDINIVVLLNMWDVDVFDILVIFKFFFYLELLFEFCGVWVCGYYDWFWYVVDGLFVFLVVVMMGWSFLFDILLFDFVCYIGFCFWLFELWFFFCFFVVLILLLSFFICLVVVVFVLFENCLLDIYRNS